MGDAPTDERLVAGASRVDLPSVRGAPKPIHSQQPGGVRLPSMLRIAFASLVVTASSAFAAPGEAWDISLELAMPGMPPGAMPAQTFRSCGPKRADAPPFTGAQSNDECQVSDAKKSGSTWTWKMSCASGVKGSGSITLKGPDAFSGKTEMTMEGQVIVTAISGKRVGPCDYKGPPPITGSAPAPAKAK